MASGQQIQTKVGEIVTVDGGQSEIRQGKTGESIMGFSHGRFHEAATRGKLFSGGMTLTSISNATFSTATLGATCTPIVGIWNPNAQGSGKYASILQAKLQTIITALQVTGAGAYMWAVSQNNFSISTGNNPLNRLTLAKSGSTMKDMSGVALTGLTNNLVVIEASSLLGGPSTNLSVLQSAAGFQACPSAAVIENFDASFQIPPGGVLALLCTTNPPVAISCASGLLWEEPTII